MNPHLRVFDNLILACARRVTLGFLDPEAARPRSAAQQALQHFDVFDPLGKRLLLAFAEDCDPMTKILRIQAVMRDFVALFVEKFFGGGVAGEDDIAEVRAAFFARYTPPMFTSVIVYLHDFVMGRGNASEVLFAAVYPTLAHIGAVFAQLLSTEKLFFDTAHRRKQDQPQRSGSIGEVKIEAVRPFWSISRYANRRQTIAISGGTMCRDAFSELTCTNVARDLDAFRWQLPVCDELGFLITVHVVRDPGRGFPQCDMALYVCEGEPDAASAWFRAAFDRNSDAYGWVVCSEKVRGTLQARLAARFGRVVFAARNLEGGASLAAMIRDHVQTTFGDPIAHPMGAVR
jgi:hypothetical protein